jgi:ribosomally synthesized peptide (two-chain TOMM family)
MTNHTTTPTPTNDPLLDFRLAYLRAIAHAWEDPVFMDTLLSQQDIQPLLSDPRFGLPSVWPQLQIRMKLDKKHPTRWSPELTAGWIGGDDAFVITLPQKPASDAVEALAAYYQLFPDFMGASVSVDLPSPSSTSLPTGLGIPGGGPGSMLAFGGVVLRAIALGWKDPAFLTALINPELTDATPVLSQWLGYNNPFNFQLRFVTNPHFVWQERNWNLQGITNTIVLNFPLPPNQESFRPIALTSYNNTGSAYPFTC